MAMWEAEALTAEIMGDFDTLNHILKVRSVSELAELGQHLYQMGNIVGEHAIVRARVESDGKS